MRIGDVMTRGVVKTRPDATLEQAAKEMSARSVGLLPVFDEDGQLAGVITDRDIAVRGVARGLGPSAPVSKAMTAQVVTCSEDQPLADARRLMKSHAVRRLLVTDRDDCVVGVISIDDLASVGDEQLADELAHIAEPAEPVGPAR